MEFIEWFVVGMLEMGRLGSGIGFLFWGRTRWDRRRRKELGFWSTNFLCIYFAACIRSFGSLCVLF